MTTPADPKRFRFHPVLIGILAVAAAVGIAGVAAFYAIPGGATHVPAGGSSAPGVPETPGPTAPQGIQRVEAQQKAMEAVFALARERQQTGITTGLAEADKRAIVAAVDAIAAQAADTLDRQGLLWMFARTCEGYRFVVTGGTSPASGPYAPVFDAAFWEAAGRLAKTPGPHAGGFLAQLAQPLADPHDRDRMSTLVRAQQAIKATPSPPPRPSPSPSATPTPGGSTRVSK
jgi:hypothetical protein